MDVLSDAYINTKYIAKHCNDNVNCNESSFNNKNMNQSIG